MFSRLYVNRQIYYNVFTSENLSNEINMNMEKY